MSWRKKAESEKRVKGQKVKEKCKERKENTEKVSEISLKKRETERKQHGCRYK